MEGQGLAGRVIALHATRRAAHAACRKKQKNQIAVTKLENRFNE
jgi:hypothetical protein